jgi:hypothetical protein
VVNRSMKVHAFGVRANDVVVILVTEFVGFVILTRMIKDRSTILQTFLIILKHHRRLRSVVLIVEIPPKKEYFVNGVFAKNVDSLVDFVCVICRELNPHSHPIMIQPLSIILKTISITLLKTFMSKNRISMVIRSKIHQILNIVEDRLKIFITSRILVTILMVLTNPHKLPTWFKFRMKK